MKAPAVKGLFAAAAAVLFAVMPLVGRSVTIDVTKFQQRYPWNGLVDIDYSISRSGGESELDPAKHSVRISVVNRAETPAVTNVAHVFRQVALPVSDGTHRVTWDANAEGINFKSQDVKVFAEVIHYAEKYMVIDVHEGLNATNYPVTYMHGAPDGGFNTDEYKTDKIALRLIPPGSFVMGSPTTEPGRTATAAREVQHPVAITRPFYIGIFEITQQQYKHVMGSSLAQFNDDLRRPVEKVKYNDIRGTADPGNNHKYDWPWTNEVSVTSFMGRLRAKCKEQNASGEWVPVSGLFDLPTDAQWEYACRAGKATPFNNGEPCATEADLETQLAKLGAYLKNNGSRTAVVGTYDPNGWGLYDMHGNVYEWCLDWYQEDVQNIENPSVDPVGAAAGSNRVVRGGCWNDGARGCRSASRGGNAPTTIYYFGFRLSRTLP